jgi:hypothetical protein
MLKLKVEGSSSKIVASSMKISLLQSTPYQVVSQEIIHNVHEFLFAKEWVFLGMKDRMQQVVMMKE